MSLHSAQEPGDCLVCRDCYGKVKHLDAVLIEEQLQWGQMSSRGQKWFESSGASKLSKSQPDTIETYATLPAEDSDLEMLDKDVINGRTDPSTFHWEYAEALMRLCDMRASRDKFRGAISRVLKAFCARNNGTGYCQGLNYVTAWLLMFMDEDAAFWMICNLIENTLLPGFYNGGSTGNSLNGFYIESGVVAGFLESFYPEIKKTGTSPLEFSDFFCLQLLIQLFVDSIDFSSAMYLWDRLVSEGVTTI